MTGKASDIEKASYGKENKWVPNTWKKVRLVSTVDT